MAYDENIAAQVRHLVAKRTHNVEEKVMFGGLCFIVEDKICLGVKKDTLLVRIAPDVYAIEIENEGRNAMMRTGKSVKTYLFVDLDQIHTSTDLAYWVSLCLDYNPEAPLSQAKQKAKNHAAGF